MAQFLHQDVKGREQAAYEPTHVDEDGGHGISWACDAHGGAVTGTRAIRGRASLAAAVEGLSEKLRLVFVLGQMKGFKYADIAEILDIPVGTVKSRMSNAEKAIRGRLSAYFAPGA